MDPGELKLRLAQREGLDPGDTRIRLVRSPGRVNLIGEHTDYYRGLVMPAAIGLQIWVACLTTGDRRVRLTLVDSGEEDGFDLDSIPPPQKSWIDYVAATAWAMQQRGLATEGFRGYLWSTLPMSAGLSSSAALELASAWAMSPGPAGPGEGVRLAQVAQLGENEYVGVRSGLMDQFAVANAIAGHALLLDCRSLQWRAVPLPANVQLVVCHTGSERKLADSQYNARRAEGERALSIIAEEEPKVESLRDVDEEMIERHRHRLDPVAWRRATHVVNENARVLETEAALLAGDWETVGRCFRDSHISLRDMYEVSSPELDLLVEIAGEIPGVLASRMTGAGFGGCTVNLVERQVVDDLIAAVNRHYQPQTGLIPSVYVVEAVAGAGLQP